MEFILAVVGVLAIVHLLGKAVLSPEERALAKKHHPSSSPPQRSVDTDMQVAEMIVAGIVQQAAEEATGEFSLADTIWVQKNIDRLISRFGGKGAIVASKAGEGIFVRADAIALTLAELQAAREAR